jgi:hypothetical protein
VATSDRTRQEPPTNLPADYLDPDNCSAPDPRRGCQINFNNVDATIGRALTDLDIGVKRGTYIRARCVDPPAGNRKWNLRARFAYVNPSGTKTVNASETCT